ncbi:MAG: hypothetical protein LBR79_01120 [Oscillospiraceae bacterium]|nr:hypothetical protein [Oscillospiraceae bacterium]
MKFLFFPPRSSGGKGMINQFGPQPIICYAAANNFALFTFLKIIYIIRMGKLCSITVKTF